MPLLVFPWLIAASLAGLPEIQGPSALPGYPDAFALGYAFAEESISPDGNYGMLYPSGGRIAGGAEKNFLAALKPFRIVAVLEGYAHTPHNRGPLAIQWANDSSALLVSVGSKWGPASVTLVRMQGGRVIGQTDMLLEVSKALNADYSKSKAPRFNEYFRFIILDEGSKWSIDPKEVRVECVGDTDPKSLDKKSWHAQLRAVWDMESGRWTKKNVTRLPVRIPNERDGG